MPLLPVLERPNTEGSIRPIKGLSAGSDAQIIPMLYSMQDQFERSTPCPREG